MGLTAVIIGVVIALVAVIGIRPPRAASLSATRR